MKKVLIIITMLILAFTINSYATEVENVGFMDESNDTRMIAPCPFNGYHEAYLAYQLAYVKEIYPGMSIYCDVYVCTHCGEGLYIDMSDWSNYYVGSTYSGIPYDHIDVQNGFIQHDGSTSLFRYLGWRLH